MHATLISLILNSVWALLNWLNVYVGVFFFLMVAWSAVTHSMILCTSLVNGYTKYTLKTFLTNDKIYTGRVGMYYA